MIHPTHVDSPAKPTNSCGRCAILLAPVFLLAAFAFAAIPTAQAEATRPNIVLLLADDMGYADPGCFGGSAVKTPHMDSIARDGIKFMRFYAASAVCTPSRASILTGRYPLRFDIRTHFPDDESHLPAGIVTLPRLLKDAGYATAHVGKWHLGGLHARHARDRANSIPGPREHGFDHYLCQIEEQPWRGILGDERLLYRWGGRCLLRDDQVVGSNDRYYKMHWTDITGEESVRQVEQLHRTGKPFFLNVWWLAPHTPYEPSPEPFWSQTAAPGISEDQHRFRSMVAQQDAWIGKILAKLDELNLRTNTLVAFLSDNGGAYEADIGGLKGGKTDLHEGGIRVPMMVRWPAQVSAGRKSAFPATTSDLLPTFCSAAGVTIPPSARVDGADLLPLFTRGESPDANRVLLWQYDLNPHLQRHYPKPKPYATEVAMRGPWKLLAENAKPTELFNIETDPKEERSLLGTQLEIEQELTAAIKGFLAAPRDRRGAPLPPK